LDDINECYSKTELLEILTNLYNGSGKMKLKPHHKKYESKIE
jgi:hypothetical protein